MNQTQTEEKLSLGIPKKFKFILQDYGGKGVVPGKSDLVNKLLITVCNLEPVFALKKSRELNKDGTVTIGVYPKQIAQTMKNRADEILNERQHKHFGITSKIESE